MAEQCIIVSTCHVFLTYSSIIEGSDCVCQCFSQETVVNNAAMNIEVVVSFLSKFPKSTISGLHSSSILIFWGASILFSIVAVPIYFPINGVWGFGFIYILVNTCFFVVVNSYSDRCEVISHSFWFWFVFPWRLWSSFHVSFGHFFVKIPIEFFYHFFFF